jgi:hypothetical protein
MRLSKNIDLYYVPAKGPVEAEIVELTTGLIDRHMGDEWWQDPMIDADAAEREIDRHWDWSKLLIEREEGIVLASRKFAVVTGDDAIQGAAMFSTAGVDCVMERGQALFVELLFTAPRNRYWLRRDKTEQFRGVGLELLCAIAEESRDLGFGGRLKLESSQSFVGWYKNRGLQVTREDRITYEGVNYTPMELTSAAASKLVADQ